MTSSRSGALPTLWRAMTSVRVTVALIGVIIGLCLLATLIAQHPTSPKPLNQLYSPAALYFLDRPGLTDIFHADWFFSILGVLTANLFFVGLDRLFRGWAALWSKSHAISGGLPGAKKREKNLVTDLATKVEREAFRKMAQGLFRGARVIRDDAKKRELQLAVQKGRAAGICRGAFYLSLVLIIAGGAIGYLKGFEAKTTVEEGSRVNYLEVLQGKTKWPPLKIKGREVPGFYLPGFEVELTRLDRAASQAVLGFYAQGKQIASARLRANEPVTFKGMRFHQVELSSTGRWMTKISVTDRKGASPGSILAEKGQTYAFEGFSVKVLDMRTNQENTGTSVQLEYTEGVKPSETFWIFENFPKFDGVHRKKSAFVFALDMAREGYSLTVRATLDPGAPLVMAGLALLVISLLGVCLLSHEEYHLIWTPARVGLVGSSDQPRAFAVRFAKVSETFRLRVERLGKPEKTAKTPEPAPEPAKQEPRPATQADSDPANAEAPVQETTT